VIGAAEILCADQSPGVTRSAWLAAIASGPRGVSPAAYTRCRSQRVAGPWLASTARGPRSVLGRFSSGAVVFGLVVYLLGSGRILRTLSRSARGARCTVLPGASRAMIATHGGFCMAWTDAATLEVVINEEQQYSLWPTHREIPVGWRKAGKSGSKAECLAWIEEVWTDMRPRSLRES
jgi:MbtH protein